MTTILHEMVHSASSKKFYSAKIDSKVRIAPGGLGYNIIHSKENSHEHFAGLTEAVIEAIVFSIWVKHQEEIIREFNLSESEIKAVQGYREYLEGIRFIIEKIAERNNETLQNVWKRFERGLFTGQKMHLRDIERTFGRGALRIVAAVGSAMKFMPAETLAQKMKEYLTTDDESKKEEIAAEILNERERLRYQNRRR